ncbi:MAG: hypothetical protein TREMPRED_003165 [Tremellales sp. Tagirdzhanova-0007]|nr:MAG: hypothetical protein TREMPRED_003165 [Tremellales sp. Tagirdzhanova-0007]
MISKLILVIAACAGIANAQVTATGTMGITNPPAATLGTATNQSSYARLLSLNAINDFCLFAPATPGQTIGDSEAVEVACPLISQRENRNNARLIPDGTFTAVHFVKTPLYWQIQGFGDFTKINIQNGDEGGELDPHGATGLGNPVGGNVTTNATGSDVSYQEWMNYMSYNQFCLRICISENATVSAAVQCQHTLDELGCEWVMPGDYTEGTFTECDGDASYPPGLYPLANGSTSTFAQRYTGTYTAGTSVGTFTVGQTVTPQTPYATPASSNCLTYSTIGNGNLAVGTGSTNSSTNSTAMTMTMNSTSSSTTSVAAVASNASTSSSSSSAASGAAAAAPVSSAASSASGSKSTASSASAASASTSSKAGALTTYTGANYGPAIAGVFSLITVLAGAGVLLL